LGFTRYQGFDPSPFGEYQKHRGTNARITSLGHPCDCPRLKAWTRDVEKAMAPTPSKPPDGYGYPLVMTNIAMENG